MEYILNADRDAAIKELELFYIDVEERLQRAGYDYYVTDREDLDDWDVFRASVQVCNGRTIFPVWQGASKPDQIIYSCEYSNYRLRFWHDYLHIVTNMDFSLDSEAFIKQLHMDAAACAEPKLSRLAQRILHAEISGQLRYWKVNGEFPHNQAAFVDSCLRHGEAIASRVKH